MSEVKETRAGGLLVTSDHQSISNQVPTGRELYRIDSNGDEVELTGADYNREVLKRLTLKKFSSSMRGILGRIDQSRLDSAAVSIERDLVERDTQIWEEKKAALTAAAHVPFDTGAARFADAKKYVWRKKTLMSDALVKASLGGITGLIPSVNASMKAQEELIWNILSSYEINVEQQMFEDRLDFNFGTEFAVECRKSIERKIDQLTWFGDSTLDITGFTNDGDVTVITPTNNDWYLAGATSAEILAEISAVMAAIQTSVADASVVRGDMPDTVVMSDRLYSYLNGAHTFGSATDASMLSVIKARFPELNWDNWTYELRGSGATSALDRMVVYKKDPSFVKAAIPVPYQERPVLQQAYSETVHAYARYVPVVVHDTRPIRYVDIDAVA